MSTVTATAVPSSDELLKAASTLELSELNSFVERVSQMAAQRRASSLPEVESALLQTINRPKPESLRIRYRELIGKRDRDALTPSEYEDLLALTEEAEAFDVERLTALVELSQLRRKPLRELMNDLGIVPPRYA